MHQRLVFKKMSQPSKKPKLSSNSEKILQELRSKISKIKQETVIAHEVSAEEVEDLQPTEIEDNIEYEEEGNLNAGSWVEKESENSQLKEEIKKLIRESENRINIKLNRIESKLNQLLNQQNDQVIEEIPEEHLDELIEETKLSPSDIDTSKIFPINDEHTFDWFFESLKNDEFRNDLISRRWSLTRNVNTKSLNIAVKEFLQFHFELPVCVKYSCSGYGSRGVKKKKLDSKTLGIFLFECFQQGLPGAYLFNDIIKGIVQFWGRAPDTLNKANDRANKREVL